MRNLILLFALLFGAFTGNSQTIVKGTGIIYTDGIPTLSALPWADAELAIDTSNGFWYEYNRDSGTWTHAGFRIQLINACAIPSYTPGDKQSYVVLDTCNNLYRFRAGTWYAIGGGGASDALGTGFTSGGGAGDIPAGTVATMLGSFEFSGGTNLTLNPGADIVIGQSGAIQNIVAPDGPGTTQGGGFRFVSGTSDGDGGDIRFESGSSNSDGNGGDAFFYAGGSAEDGNGGDLNFASGTSVGGLAGNILFNAADAYSGGNFSMRAGNSSGSGYTGGGVTISAGDASGAASNGGGFSMISGDAVDGSGGGFSMTAGNAGGSGYQAGNLTMTAGNNAAGAGGNIFLNPGTGSTSGTVRLTAPSGFRAIQNIGSINSSDKTFTWPNQSATLSTAISGTAAPSSTPVSLGQIYVDTVNLKIYISAGTSSSADWLILN